MQTGGRHDTPAGPAHPPTLPANADLDQLHAGTVVYHGRGEYGIAWAALAAGRLDLAAHHAGRYAELIEALPDAFADWDRAFAAEILARVAAVRGAPDAAERRAEAVRLADAVAEEEERAVVRDRLARDPW